MNQPQTPVIAGAASVQNVASDVPLRPSTVMEYVAATLTADDQQVLGRFWREWVYMNNERSKHHGEWELWERQFDANISAGDAAGIKSGIKQELSTSAGMVTMQTDRNILEQHLGEEGFKVPFKIVPEGKEADSKALDVTRHVMDYFLHKEDAVTELIDFRWDRGKYGTGILHAGVWATRTVNNRPLDGHDTGTRFEQRVSVQYHVGLKNVNVWDFWMDERARRWKDVRRCVWREVMDVQEFRATYAGRPGFKYVEAVQPVKQDFMSPEEYNYEDSDQTGEPRKVYLFHYFNEVTGEYWVIANRAWPVYVGWNILKDSKLPFEVSQMYKRSESKYGLAVGGKSQSFLAYMNNLFGAALDKAFLTSNPPLVVGGGGSVDGEIYSGGSEINTLNFNGDASQLFQMKLDSNVQIHQAMIEMANNQIVQNTGINPSAFQQSTAGINAFVAGVQEQARKAKIALSQALYDVAVGKALTKMLFLLTRFGPQLYADVMEKVVDGKPLKSVKWLDVKVEGKTVTKKDGVMKFEDAPGDYGYFEFTPDMFKDPKSDEYYDMAVRVTTPTTETVLQSLKKADFETFVKSLQVVQQMFPGQQLPVTAEEMYEIASEAFAIDPTGVFSKTSDRQAREENAKLNEAALSLNPDNVAKEAGLLPEGQPSPQGPGNPLPPGSAAPQSPAAAPKSMPSAPNPAKDMLRGADLKQAAGV